MKKLEESWNKYEIAVRRTTQESHYIFVLCSIYIHSLVISSSLCPRTSNTMRIYRFFFLALPDSLNSAFSIFSSPFNTLFGGHIGPEIWSPKQNSILSPNWSFSQVCPSSVMPLFLFTQAKNSQVSYDSSFPFQFQFHIQSVILYLHDMSWFGTSPHLLLLVQTTIMCPWMWAIN